MARMQEEKGNTNMEESECDTGQGRSEQEACDQSRQKKSSSYLKEELLLSHGLGLGMKKTKSNTTNVF